MKREPQRAESLSKVAEVIKDRVRVPWLWGGARKVDLSIIPPLILLPALLHLAALHFLLGLLVLTALPGLVLWYYYFTHYKKGRTLFFLSLALFSLGYMYYLFITEVLPSGNISLVQVSMVTVGVILTLLALVHTKQEPGVVLLSQNPGHCMVRRDRSLAVKDTGIDGARQDATMAAASSTGTSEQAAVEPDESGRRNWCTACRALRPPRAGHCQICGVCVLRLDHHCVWWVPPKCLPLNCCSFLFLSHLKYFAVLNLSTVPITKPKKTQTNLILVCESMSISNCLSFQDVSVYLLCPHILYLHFFQHVVLHECSIVIQWSLCRVLSTCVGLSIRLHRRRGRINSCVGQANHRSFLLTLILFLLTSLYGISLVLESVCPQQHLFLALLYCPGVYNQYRWRK